MVTVKEKKEFIEWFVKQYQLKRRECLWILNYIATKESRLDSIHFITREMVDTCRQSQKVMVMSTQCSDTVPFRYYKHSVMTTDAEKSFHDFRLNNEDQYFICVMFSDDKGSEYFSVVEDELVEELLENDGLEDAEEDDEEARPKLKPSRLSDISPKVEPIIDNLLLHIEYNKSADKLKKEIDEALQRGDKKAFMKLSTEYNKLVQPNKLFETIKK